MSNWNSGGVYNNNQGFNRHKAAGFQGQINTVSQNFANPPAFGALTRSSPQLFRNNTAQFAGAATPFNNAFASPGRPPFTAAPAFPVANNFSPGGVGLVVGAPFSAAAINHTFSPVVLNETVRNANGQQTQLKLNFLSISGMPQYNTKSYEEIRSDDYRSRANPQQAAPSGFSSFGQPAAAPATPFGQPAAAVGIFGVAAPGPALQFGAAPAPTFGAPAAGLFNQPAATPAAGMFGMQPAASQPTFGVQPAFGQPAPAAFGATLPTTGSAFGAIPTNPMFGAPAAAPPQFSGLFNPQQANPMSAFGQPQTAAPSPFGFPAVQAAPTAPAFGAASLQGPTGGFGAFGTQPVSSAAAPFGQLQATGAFNPNPFGAPQQQQLQQPMQPFGQPASAPTLGAGGFGASFGQPGTGFSSFGQTAAAPAAAPPANFGFGSPTAAPAGSGFGSFGGFNALGAGAAAAAAKPANTFVFPAPAASKPGTQPKPASGGFGSTTFAGFGTAAVPAPAAFGGTAFGCPAVGFGFGPAAPAAQAAALEPKKESVGEFLKREKERMEKDMENSKSWEDTSSRSVSVTAPRQLSRASSRIPTRGYNDTGLISATAMAPLPAASLQSVGGLLQLSGRSSRRLEINTKPDQRLSLTAGSAAGLSDGTGAWAGAGTETRAWARAGAGAGAGAGAAPVAGAVPSHGFSDKAGTAAIFGGAARATSGPNSPQLMFGSSPRDAADASNGFSLAQPVEETKQHSAREEGLGAASGGASDFMFGGRGGDQGAGPAVAATEGSKQSVTAIFGGAAADGKQVAKQSAPVDGSRNAITGDKGGSSLFGFPLPFFGSKTPSKTVDTQPGGEQTGMTPAKQDTPLAAERAPLPVPPVAFGMGGGIVPPKPPVDSAGQAAAQSPELPLPAPPTLTDPEYSSSPPIHELRAMGAEQLRAVRDFKVRNRHGEIFWPGETDLTGGLRLNEIIEINEREVEVKHESVPGGTCALNKRATVTLVCVRPKSGKNQDLDNFEQRLRKGNAVSGARFVSYDQKTGKWVFEVDHFSKHGFFSDSDDEAEPDSRQAAARAVTAAGGGVAGGGAAKGGLGRLSTLPVTDLSDGGKGSPLDDFATGAAMTPSRDRADDDDEELDAAMILKMPSHQKLRSHKLDLDLIAPAGAVGGGAALDPFARVRILEPYKYAHLAADIDVENLAASQSNTMSNFPQRSFAVGLGQEHKVKSGTAVSAATSKRGRDERSLNAQWHPTVPIVERAEERDGASGSTEAARELWAKKFDAFENLLERHKDTSLDLAGEGLSAKLLREVRVECGLAAASSGSAPGVQPCPATKLAHERRMMDFNISMRRSFRVGWGPQGQLVHSGLPTGLIVSGSSGNSAGITAANAGQRITIEAIQLCGGEPDPRAYEGPLLALFTHPSSHSPSDDSVSDMDVSGNVDAGNSVEQWVPPRIDFYHDKEDYASFVGYVQGCLEHFRERNLEPQDADWASQQVVQLFNAVFGQELTCDGVTQPLDDLPPYEYDVPLGETRMEAISSWLQNLCTPEVVDVDEGVDDGRAKSSPATYKRIFQLLSVRRVHDAVEVAENAGLFRLALLLGQADGDKDLCGHLLEQLQMWRGQRVNDRTFPPDLLRIYRLLAGCPIPTDDFQGADEVFNASLLKGVGWARAVAVFLWYSRAGGSQPVCDALEAYKCANWDEAAGEGADNVDEAVPAYCRRNNLPAPARAAREKILDCLYSLVKVFFDHSLNNDDATELDMQKTVISALHPEAVTSRPLDYRSSYVTLTLLQCAGYISGGPITVGAEETPQLYRPGVAACIVRSHFISQLLSIGLWHWAIFIARQVEDRCQREWLVKDIVCRYGGVDMTADAWGRFPAHDSPGGGLAFEFNADFPEYFVVSELEVPEGWMHEAAAVRLGYARDGAAAAADKFAFAERQVQHLQAAQHSAHETICAHLAPYLCRNKGRSIQSLQEADSKLSRYLSNDVDAKDICDFYALDNDHTLPLSRGNILLNFLELKRELAKLRGGEEQVKSAYFERLPDLVKRAEVLLAQLTKVYCLRPGSGPRLDRDNNSEDAYPFDLVAIDIGTYLYDVLSKVSDRDLMAELPEWTGLDLLRNTSAAPVQVKTRLEHLCKESVVWLGSAALRAAEVSAGSVAEMDGR